MQDESDTKKPDEPLIVVRKLTGEEIAQIARNARRARAKLDGQVRRAMRIPDGFDTMVFRARA